MKVLAIASGGGHWVQMLRILPAFAQDEIEYVSTNPQLESVVEGSKFYHVPDFSRWNKLKLIQVFGLMFKIIAKSKPDVIISTGAAPGLIGIITGRIFNVKTIWVDSIANVEKISMSCKLSTFFAHRVYTQWPHLASNKIFYSGNVLS